MKSLINLEQETIRVGCVQQGPEAIDVLSCIYSNPILGNYLASLWTFSRSPVTNATFLWLT